MEPLLFPAHGVDRIICRGRDSLGFAAVTLTTEQTEALLGAVNEKIESLTATMKSPHITGPVREHVRSQYWALVAAASQLEGLSQ